MLIFLFSTGFTPLTAQPDAYFTADTNRINSLEVAFMSTYTDADTIAYTFLWDFGDGTTENHPNITHLYPQAGTYRVSLTVTDTTDTDTFALDITVRDELMIPNVFTPNDDGINDYFILRTNGITEYTLTIFTRKGLPLTTLKGTSLVWDGKLPSGRKAAPGVYYFLLSDKQGNSKKGFFHLFY